MKILVPSYGRAGFASTMDLIPDAFIVVPEKQSNDYEKFYPNRVWSIDDTKDGSVPKKRNACLDLVDEDELFWMLDDDLQYVHKIKGEEVTEIIDILENHFYVMEQLNISFGGFALSHDPVKYAEYSPFSFTKPSWQCVAIRKHKNIRYDEELKRFEDADYYLQVMKEKKIVLRDNRYFFTFECNKDVSIKSQVGGIEGDDVFHAESLNVLINRWGDLIKMKDGKMNGVKQPFKGV